MERDPRIGRLLARPSHPPALIGPSTDRNIVVDLSFDPCFATTSVGPPE